MIGQRRKVSKGEYKGFEGTIKGFSDNFVKFELSAKNRVVTLPFAYLNIQIEDKTKTQNNMTQYATNKTSNYNMNSPYKNFSTPMHNPDNF